MNKTVRFLLTLASCMTGIAAAIFIANAAIGFLKENTLFMISQAFWGLVFASICLAFMALIYAQKNK